MSGGAKKRSGPDSLWVWLTRTVFTSAAFAGALQHSGVGIFVLALLAGLSIGNVAMWRRFRYSERDMRLWWTLLVVQCVLIARVAVLSGHVPGR